MALCMSDLSLVVDTGCGLSIDTSNMPPAASTTRIQTTAIQGQSLPRNAAAGSYPFIGDDVYATCSDRIKAITADTTSTTGKPFWQLAQWPATGWGLP